MRRRGVVGATMVTSTVLSDPVRVVLVGFAIFQIKHFICDYVLQTAWQYQNKGKYGHPGGLFHAAVHVVGTSFVFLLIPPTAALAAAILIGEFIVHYHIDFTKEQITRRAKWTLTDAGYWWTLGADQMLHHLTYVAILAVLIGGLAR